MTTIESVTTFFSEIDSRIKQLKIATGLRCPSGCGVCCESRNVETTVLETLPLANRIYDAGEEGFWASRIESALANNDARCVFYAPEPDAPGSGRCSIYPWRPGVCRMFGFAARRDKHGCLEFRSCKRINTEFSDIVADVVHRLPRLPEIPVYQNVFCQIMAIHPELGRRKRPINRAVMEGLEYLYWKRPRRPPLRKAS